MASVPAPPKSYADALVALPDDFHPYGPKCALQHDVQTAAFHHGLTKIHVESLVDFGFDTVVSFGFHLELVMQESGKDRTRLKKPFVSESNEKIRGRGRVPR